MTTEFIWTVPTHGDGRDAVTSLRKRGDWHLEDRGAFAPSVRDERPGHFTYYDYLTQVARAAEATGFDGLFVPYDPAGEESWIVASALARETPRLALLAEIHPGLGSAVYTAKLALSFQRFFANRLSWKFALDGDAKAQQAVGDFVEPADRVGRLEELIAVTKGAWFDAPFSFHGQYFDAEATGFFLDPQISLRPGFQLQRRPYPKLYLDGTTEDALDLSARHADVHLLASTEPTAVGHAIALHRERTAVYGRQVAYGLRLGVIARDTTTEAWRRAERLWNQSVGQARRLDGLRADDQLFLGFSELGSAAASGLIGSYAEVTERLDAYAALGVSSFVLDGLPHVEEAHRLGEYVLARLESRVVALATA